MKRQLVAVVAVVVILAAVVVIWFQATHKAKPSIPTGVGGPAAGSSGQGGPQALPPEAAGKAGAGEAPKGALRLPPGKPPR